MTSYCTKAELMSEAYMLVCHIEHLLVTVDSKLATKGK